MIGLYVIIIFSVLITLLIVGIVSLYSMKETKEQQKELNENVLNHLINKDFNATKIIYLDDNATFGKGDLLTKKFISIDSQNKKILLVDYVKSCYYIIDFEDFLNYEIYENGNTVTDGAQIGGFFSGLFTASSTTKCTDLRLIIKINSIEISQVSYNIIEHGNLGGVEKTSNIYRECVAKLQEATSVLDVILKGNKK